MPSRLCGRACGSAALAVTAVRECLLALLCAACVPAGTRVVFGWEEGRDREDKATPVYVRVSGAPEDSVCTAGDTVSPSLSKG